VRPPPPELTNFRRGRKGPESKKLCVREKFGVTNEVSKMAKVCYAATFGSLSCDKIFGCKHSILKLLVSGTGSALLLQTGLTVCLTLPLIFGIKLTQMEWSKKWRHRVESHKIDESAYLLNNYCIKSTLNILRSVKTDERRCFLNI